jgi:hypothetical protein
VCAGAPAILWDGSRHGNSLAGVVSRHASLGARVTGRFPFWTVLADPAGREYCLVERDPRGS